MTRFFLLALLAALPLTGTADELQTFENCSLVPTEWGDADSFRIKFPSGDEATIRLYGVDAFERMPSGNESDRDRFREQCAWFGVADSFAARDLGEEARTAAWELLASPFRVTTSFADARGAPEYSRVYAFVTTAGGFDLAEYLVSNGHARAHGVTRARPDGPSSEAWRSLLSNLELKAARFGAGGWRFTDWERLPELREELRHSAEIDQQLAGGAILDPATKIDPNTASRDELLLLPGIGETIAFGIIERRPFKTIEDLLEVPYLGSKTLERIAIYLEIQSEEPEPPAPLDS